MVNWICGKSIKVYGPSQWQSAVMSAAQTWNDAFAYAPGATGVPTIAWGGTSGDVQLIVTGSGPLFCGGTDSPPDFIVMTTDNGPSCPTNSADFATTLVHEFAHVLGIKDGILESDSAPVNCAIHLPSNGTINGTLCQHEIELIYAGYGLRGGPGPTFWSTPIVTGLSVSPASVSLQENQTLTVTATSLVFGRQLTPAPAPLGGASVTWTSDNTVIAEVTPGGLITGLEVGSTKVRGKVSGLTSSYLAGTLMIAGGQEVTVTITPGPPPGTGFRVSDITGITPPITTAGSYPITASVVQKPAGTLQIAWKIVYSNTPLDTLRISYGPNSYPLNAPAGSYTVRVYARPRVVNVFQGDSTFIVGAEGIRDFTVCTGGGGGGGNVAPILEENDAVGGC